MDLVSCLAVMAAGCEVIILTVQIINWFSKSRIAYVLALFLWSQALGYITWINIEYPNNDIKLLIAGVLFAFIAVFDYFYFFYTPTQANIFIGESTRSKQDRLQFDAYSQSAMRNQVSIFHLVKKDQKENRVSFAQPFKYTDFILLFISASFKVAASLVNYDLTALLYDFINADDVSKQKALQEVLHY